MRAQTATGTRRSCLHTAPERKLAAQTACIQAGASWNSQSTGGSSDADARHLVDGHRVPRQMPAYEGIVGLCEQGTSNEYQLRTMGRWDGFDHEVHMRHTGGRFEGSGSVFRSRCYSPRMSPA